MSDVSEEMLFIIKRTTLELALETGGLVKIGVDCTRSG